MQIGMTELPTIEEELNRKAFEELESLFKRRELGQITNAEYSASISTLFAVCNGIVDRKFFEMITLAGDEVVKDFSFAQTRVFKKSSAMGTTLAVLLKKASGETLVMTSTEIGAMKLKEVDGIYEKTIESLVNKGFVEANY